MKYILLLAVFGTVSSFHSARADLITNIPEVGNHYRLFNFEKNINPQNILIVYTKLDEKCRFVTDPSQRDQPTFDFYWMMDGTKYKPVNPLIKSGIRDRLEFQNDPANRDTSFFVKINDLKEMEHDLPDSTMHVVARAGKTGCEVDGTVRLGASAKNETITLTKIYTEAKNQGGLYPTPTSITLTGVSTKSGQVISATFHAKKK